MGSFGVVESLGVVLASSAGVVLVVVASEEGAAVVLASPPFLLRFLPRFLGRVPRLAVG